MSSSHADLLSVLDELEDVFDKQIHPQQVATEFDVPDGHQYTVNITAGLWREFNRALTKAHRSDEAVSK